MGKIIKILIVSLKHHCREYSLDSEGRPLNPFGRTGMRGRGTFGKWGPNHAADAIVSRRTPDGRLQFVAIERHDTGFANFIYLMLINE